MPTPEEVILIEREDGHARHFGTDTGTLSVSLASTIKLPLITEVDGRSQGHQGVGTESRGDFGTRLGVLPIVVSSTKQFWLIIYLVS